MNDAKSLEKDIARYVESQEFMAKGLAVCAQVRTALEAKGFTVGESTSEQKSDFRGRPALYLPFEMGTPSDTAAFEVMLTMQVAGAPSALRTTVTANLAHRESGDMLANSTVFCSEDSDCEASADTAQALLTRLEKTQSEEGQDWQRYLTSTFATTVSNELSY